eukprot:superscaffoldBa00001704_g11696
MTAAATEAKQAAAAHEQVLTMLAGQLQQLSALLTQAPQAAGAASPPAPPATASAPAPAPLPPMDAPEPRVGIPEHYEGDQETCGPFLTNCSLLFALQPHTFTTEGANVAFVINHLTGRARLWGTGGRQPVLPLTCLPQSFARCLQQASLPLHSPNLSSSPNLSGAPPEYLDFCLVFSKAKATSLPLHRPYDCAIDLLPGTSPSKGCLYSLSQPKRKAMETYINDSLAAGLIRPASSPAGKEFCSLLGATASLSFGFHPQTNGQMERMNQELETALRCMASQNPSSWSSQLLCVEYAHNSLICSATGLYPFQCAYGYQPLLFPTQQKEVSCPSVQAFIRRCRRTWLRARSIVLWSVDCYTAAANGLVPCSIATTSSTHR